MSSNFLQVFVFHIQTNIGDQLTSLWSIAARLWGFMTVFYEKISHSPTPYHELYSCFVNITGTVEPQFSRIILISASAILPFAFVYQWITRIFESQTVRLWNHQLLCQHHVLSVLPRQINAECVSNKETVCWALFLINLYELLKV